MTIVGRVIWTLTGVYWAALFTLTHWPKLRPPPGGVSDKSAHFLGYGALAGAIFLSMWAWNPRRRWLAVWVLVTCAAYGALDELTQPLPWFKRTCDFRDWVADVSGTLVAVVVLGTIKGVMARRRGADKMAA